MTRLSQEKIGEIRQSVDIVDVMGQYLELHKKGKNYMAICPFHDDNHPSLSISQSRQIYKCFVCGNGGNVFTFIQEYLKVPFVEAVMKVAEFGHVDMSGYSLEKRVVKVDEALAPLYDMHAFALKLYMYYLYTQSGKQALDYLRHRGFDDDLIKMFGIGYAPEKSILHERFQKEGYTEVAQVKSGLVLENERHYDRFHDRVMFPLYDEFGKVVGFSGRVYKAQDKNSKYMNSPESDIFIKGKTLYNYHRAKEAVRQAGFVYINEGFMDVIAMHRAHHDNCIALMGTALTKDHLRMLKRMTRTIHLCLDGDMAGQAAAMKSSDLLTSQGFEVKIVLLPDGRDPDEILSTEGIEGLDAVLKDTLSPIDFMMAFECSRLDLRNYEDRKTLLVKACEKIAKIEDRIDRGHYIAKLSSLTDFPKEIIEEQLLNSSAILEHREQFSQNRIETIQDQRPILDKYTLAEKNLLFYMLNDRQVSDIYEAKAGFMHNDTYRALAAYIRDYYRTHKTMDVANLIDNIGSSHSALVNALTDIAECSLPLPYQKEVIDDYIARITENTKNIREQELQQQFKDVLAPSAKAEILQKLIDLKKE
ncbi:DNA primase [Roseburia hominis]|uniref:DNA primase n=1 Tax=Catenibacterium mitsuokai TaxID=100886 RepID=UPI0006C5EE59|nr:DNA primase [Catenibacterium mitsuokai]CUO88534.1 DNA primase [Catenibacterium mitsuokai]CUP46624.1 DNA primase [Roseburia hominis]